MQATLSKVGFTGLVEFFPSSFPTTLFQADFLEYFPPIFANCAWMSVINSNQVQFILLEQLEEA